MKFFKFNLLILIIACMYSCTPNEGEFIGSYIIDHPVPFDGATINHREVLTLKENHEFELSGNGIDKSLHGTWKVKESTYHKGSSGGPEPQATIIFNYNDASITGELEGSIFYFQHPNIFRPEKQKNVLYVRSNNP